MRRLGPLPDVHGLVIAGGAGKRIRSVARATPKAMLRIGDWPVVGHQIRLLSRYGIGFIHLTVRKRELAVFNDYLGLGHLAGVHIRCYGESKPLGTAGGVKPILAKLAPSSSFPARTLVVFYGDVMIHMDLDALLKFHRDHSAAATLVVHPTDHPQDSDLVELDANDRIWGFHCKPHKRRQDLRNLGNAAIYVLSPDMAGHIPDGACDFMRDVFPAALAAGLPLFGYRTREYLKDIGTPTRLAAVRRDCAAGRIERRHLEHALPAVFFDRDGTLCEHVPLLHKAGDMHLLPTAAEAVLRVNQSDFLAVLVTNQPVVAQGLCTLRDLDRIHGRMEMMLGKRGAKLDGIYFCPHFPKSGYPGEVAALKIACECRKPGGALVQRAALELNIDLARSFFVGDTTRDVETGKRLGLRTVLVQTGQAGRDGKFAATPDFVCADAAEAVEWILRRAK